MIWTKPPCLCVPAVNLQGCSVQPPHSNHPKNPDPSKVATLRTRTPAIQVQTPIYWRVQWFLGQVFFVQGLLLVILQHRHGRRLALQWLRNGDRLELRLGKSWNSKASYLQKSPTTSKDKDMAVSKNRGTPKWMVYNGKALLKWMIWGYHYFWKHPYRDYRDLKSQ